jgi:hypothetical protein
MTRNSHKFVISDVAEEFDLLRGFARHLAQTKPEREPFTSLHAFAGKMPRKTGRHECRLCGCLLNDPACEQFRRSLVREVERVFDDYYEAFCPECGERYEDQKPIRVVDHGPRVFKVSEEPVAAPEPAGFDTVEMVEYGCGCRFEPGEQEVVGAGEALNEDARDGELWDWEGRAVHETGELEGAIHG